MNRPGIQTQSDGVKLEACPFCAAEMIVHAQHFSHPQHPDDDPMFCPLIDQAWRIEFANHWNTRALASRPTELPLIFYDSSERDRRIARFIEFLRGQASEGRMSVQNVAQLADDLEAYTTPTDEAAELRAERDALLQKPIDLAKMDSIDDDACDKMVAYYWWQQAQEAREALAMRRVSAVPDEGWRDIATAPKDGTDIILHYDLASLGSHWPRTIIGHWREESGNKLGSWVWQARAFRGYSDCYKPTFWQPLPNPPGAGPTAMPAPPEGVVERLREALERCALGFEKHARFWTADAQRDSSIESRVRAENATALAAMARDEALHSLGDGRQ